MNAVNRSCRNCFHSRHDHDRLICKNPGGAAHERDERGVCSRAMRSPALNADQDRRCIDLAARCAYWCEETPRAQPPTKYEPGEFRDADEYLRGSRLAHARGIS